jgi:alkanesulfonate monooxygenase SsuD/methylene tetrahydromethanopterin reductase-like flavin-dependent oxidoreductase (luciferase family)
MSTRPVTFGAFIPQGWKTELLDIHGAQAKWAMAVEIAELAERLGYDSIWVYDHFHNVPVPAHETVFECWTTLTAIGGSTFGEPFDSWQAGNLVGTPEQVIDKIGRYREMGVTSFLPWNRDYPSTDTLQLVAERVIPAFR